jgi:hypothetical protein
MTPLDLRQSLRVEVIMIERQFSFLLDKAASLLPTRQFRNKVTGRGEFNIQLQPLF